MTITMFAVGILLTTLGLSTATAQEIVLREVWEANGFGENHDLIPSPDNGFLVGGWMTDTSLGQSYLLGYDADGTERRRTLYENFILWKVIERSGSGHILVGRYSGLVDPARPLVVIGMDANGEVDWTRSLPDTLGQTRNPIAFIRTRDGRYLLIAEIRTNDFRLELLYLDDDGQTVSKGMVSYGGEQPMMKDVIEMEDGSLQLISNDQMNSGDTSYYSPLIKNVDEQGTMLGFIRPLDGKRADSSVTFQFMQRTIDGGYLAVGNLYLISPESGRLEPDLERGDFHAVKFDSTMTIEWERSYDFGGLGDRVKSFTQISDSVYLIAGVSSIEAVPIDGGTLQLLALDLSGKTVWGHGFDEWCARVSRARIAADGDIIVTGTIGCLNTQIDAAIWRIVPPSGTVGVEMGIPTIQMLDLAESW